MNQVGTAQGAAASAEGLATQQAQNSLTEQTAKAAANEKFRNEMVMSLIGKLPSARF